MKPRSIFFMLLASVVLALSPAVSTAQTVIAPAGRHVARESIEWIRLWLPNVNKEGLPQVLLIGDSITVAYYDDVARDLKGKAYVGYFASSLSVGDPMLPKQIALILRNYKFDVIHFNNGLHGKDYSKEEYARCFPQYVKTIEANAHGGRLIWASSTPVRTGKEMSEFAPWTKRVAARNKIADAYVRKRGIPIDDLYGAVLHHPEYYLGVDGTHPNAEGRAAEARDVAASILKALGK
ncbi:MAG TPA: SGNH/GDSL hydrolase family protein [Terriglobia bacterium]|nr:SGNH/GDSL hydrolase family protein [Terriglobia bacterium]